MGRARTILIVEDELIVAEDLRVIMASYGYHVVGICPSSDEALRCAHDLKPDLVTMDISIQGEWDGIETARRILQDRRTPIIFITANSDLGTMMRAKDISPWVIAKPILERDLRLAADMAMQQFPSNASSTPAANTPDGLITPMTANQAY